VSPITDAFLLLVSAVVIVTGAIVITAQLAKGKRLRLASKERRRQALEAARRRRLAYDFDGFIGEVNRASSPEDLDTIIRESRQE
jgi:hypothetical protein